MSKQMVFCVLCLGALFGSSVYGAECGIDIKLRDHQGSFQKFLVKAKAVSDDESEGPGREAKVSVRFQVGWRDENGRTQSTDYARCFFVKWGVPSETSYFELRSPRARSLEVLELSCRNSAPDDQCQDLWNVKRSTDSAEESEG